MATNKYICSTCPSGEPCIVVIEQDHVKTPTACVMSQLGGTEPDWTRCDPETKIKIETTCGHKAEVEAEFIGDFCVKSCPHLGETAECLFCRIGDLPLDIQLGSWIKVDILAMRSPICKAIFK